mmetsp:Transcript_27881/g.81961  ORF Transcript_27881/g.81961 Transcript_27881/m.81961 type:complete len:207 (-) Transcript_27881:217-837(-)
MSATAWTRGEEVTAVVLRARGTYARGRRAAAAAAASAAAEARWACSDESASSKGRPMACSRSSQGSRVPRAKRYTCVSTVDACPEVKSDAGAKAEAAPGRFDDPPPGPMSTSLAKEGGARHCTTSCAPSSVPCSCEAPTMMLAMSSASSSSRRTIPTCKILTRSFRSWPFASKVTCCGCFAATVHVPMRASRTGMRTMSDERAATS